MPTLIIERPSHWMTREKAYRLFINGKQLGSIKNGETIQYSIEPGNHILKTDIDWFRSHTMVFEIQPDEKKVLKVDGAKYGALLLPFYLLCLLAWYILQNFIAIDYFVLWGAHLLLYILIMFSILFRKGRYVREVEIG
ncbi:hypothetical protein PP178_04985 [Zeaxanthinibacter sp. PT1]|uniref:hypothetical protein n=1 Tax=Zeaxanthinibacter TaxID=561554 RepID=UPI00234A6E36|nr:hypothetical protein [Zeaxanthinibacter sp. PT1]MDC6350896.1 hypothetical protein [Zeaxanthinibacter sp. PT1]